MTRAGMATYFQSVNRNKRSVALDLASAAGRGRARELVAGADVVVENFRPGVMERLGLGLRGAAGVRSLADLLLDQRRSARARARSCRATTS